MNQKNYTYLELNEWTKSVFDNFGKIIIEKYYDNDDKIEWYKDNIEDLKDKLELKIKKIKTNDIKDDLKDLLNRVKILDKYLKDNF